MQCCTRDGVAGMLFSPKSVVQDLGHVLGMPTNVGHGAKATSLWGRALTKHNGAGGCLVWCQSNRDHGEGLFHDPSGSLRRGSSLLCGLKDGYGFRSVSCGCSTDLVRSVLAAEEALQARKQICGLNCKGVDASWGSEQDGWVGFLMIDWEVLSIELEAHVKYLEKTWKSSHPAFWWNSILGLDLLVPEAYNFVATSDRN
ncbi:hypothetical protein ZIOFF_013090 [Zingiber officinale]|uniref:Uncharacterized protein n=1 Tax=Zingiber officinale TaxID=94328 RepID=A0A8J5H8B2_ZINOF|nr:hypothetical protein ZIOFF_013090 [Zingiber officinale]